MHYKSNGRQRASYNERLPGVIVIDARTIVIVYDVRVFQRPKVTKKPPQTFDEAMWAANLFICL
ncbi:hypothetical protein [Nicoliella spurrieriana]|uniref:hypothetical protein n=1 Tax=Nicoliella spurrieriana TaxID=2925830 RepID=UPI0021A861ED|nr:hypothetical protein [Nicoliella spurrieriana]